MRRTDGVGGVEKVLKEKKIRETGGRRHTLFLPPSPPPPLCSSLANENERAERPRGPNRSAPLYLSLCSLLLSHPFPLFFLPPSVLSSPSPLPSSSLFHSLPPSPFMLLLIIALTSLPLSLHLSHRSSPTGVGLHPRVSAWTGPRERRRGRMFQMDGL